MDHWSRRDFLIWEHYGTGRCTKIFSTTPVSNHSLEQDRVSVPTTIIFFTTFTTPVLNHALEQDRTPYRKIIFIFLPLWYQLIEINDLGIFGVQGWRRGTMFQEALRTPSVSRILE